MCVASGIVDNSIPLASTVALSDVSLSKIYFVFVVVYFAAALDVIFFTVAVLVATCIVFIVINVVLTNIIVVAVIVLVVFVVCVAQLHLFSTMAPLLLFVIVVGSALFLFTAAVDVIFVAVWLNGRILHCIVNVLDGFVISARTVVVAGVSVFIFVVGVALLDVLLVVDAIANLEISVLIFILICRLGILADFILTEVLVFVYASMQTKIKAVLHVGLKTLHRSLQNKS